MVLFLVTIVLFFIGLQIGLHPWKDEKTDETTVPIGLRALAIVSILPTLCWFAGYSKIDDSFLYARYVANALAGRGMVFNAGEHVNALSSPLFAYLLLFVSWLLHGNVLLATTVVSGGFLLLACLLAETMVPFSGLLLASTAYFYTLVGMETSLFVFLLLLVVWLFQSEKYEWIPLASILLILTRFEGALLVAVIAWRLFRNRALPRPVALLPAFLLGGGYLVLNHHFYGAYLPSSAVAKLEQGFSGYWGRWPTAFLGHLDLLLYCFGRAVFLLPLLFGLAVAGVLKKPGSLDSRVVLLFCGMLLVFYVGLNVTGFYFWYFAPFLLFMILYAASAIPRTLPGAASVGVVVVLLVLGNARLLERFQPEERYLGYVDAGTWLRQNTRPEARVAAVEIGLVGWYSERYVIDVVGLTRPKNALHIARHDMNSWLAEDKPDYIVLHRGDFPFETIARRSDQYVEENTDFRGGVYLVRRKDYRGGDGREPVY
jgi:arabinofuranosyltransferase